MQIADLATWEDLLAKVTEIREMRKETGRQCGVPTSPLLFRGQSNSAWELSPTLERHAVLPYSFAEYFRLLSAVRPHVETFTSRRWKLGKYKKLDKWSREYDNLKLTDFPGYEFLIYLRHHGFPSPLLDWTRSLYVAAYFAIEEAKRERFAIFIFWEDTGVGKSSGSSEAQIKSFGPYVRSHARHFNQQSAYTVCAQFCEDQWWYTKYAQIPSSYELSLQDKLYKLTVPATEREKALAHLDAMNINALSLFQSEESLMRTLAIRELTLRGHEL